MVQRHVMRGFGIGLLGVAVLAIGCGGESSGEPGPGKASTAATGATGTGGATPQLPQTVQIEILDAMIYPSPKNGECWDNFCSLTQDDFNKVAEALASSGDPYAVAAAVAVALGGILNEAGAPPDPIASATIWDGGAFASPVDLAHWGHNYSDTYTPTWLGDEAHNNAKGWTAVPLNDGLRIRVDIQDTDSAGLGDPDDPIGVVEINYDDAVAAYLAKQSYPVRVDDQGSGLVLFVGISVQGL